MVWVGVGGAGVREGEEVCVCVRGCAWEGKEGPARVPRAGALPAPPPAPRHTRTQAYIHTTHTHAPPLTRRVRAKSRG